MTPTSGTDRGLRVPAKSLIGYAGELVTVPGATVDFMVSSRDPFDASIVRLKHEPGGHETRGFSAAAVANLGSCEADEQRLNLGSRIRVTDRNGSLCPRSFSVSAWIYPTKLGTEPQLILGCWGDKHGFGLFVSTSGISLRVGRPGEVAETRPLAAPRERDWCFVAGSYDHLTGNAHVVSHPMPAVPLGEPGQRGSYDIGIGDHSVDSGFFTIAGADDGKGQARWSFNGKLEEPRLLDQALDGSDLLELRVREGWRRWEACTVGAWDFSQGHILSPCRRSFRK